VKKGKVYCRLINGEIVQTVSLFKPHIVPSFALNIGIFPLCMDLDEILLYEGNFRLGNFANLNDSWIDYNPFSYKDIKLSMDEAYSAIIEEVVPVLENVTDYISYKRYICEYEERMYGYVAANSYPMMWVYLKLHNYDEAVDIINGTERQNYEAASANKNIFTKEEYSKYLEEVEQDLSSLRAVRSAVEKGDEVYIESLLKRNEEESNAILKKHGMIGYK
jgi:hypothetical protein